MNKPGVILSVKNTNESTEKFLTLTPDGEEVKSWTDNCNRVEKSRAQNKKVWFYLYGRESLTSKMHDIVQTVTFNGTRSEIWEIFFVYMPKTPSTAYSQKGTLVLSPAWAKHIFFNIKILLFLYVICIWVVKQCLYFKIGNNLLMVIMFCTCRCYCDIHVVTCLWLIKLIFLTFIMQVYLFKWVIWPWGAQVNLCLTDVFSILSESNMSVFFLHNLDKNYRANFLLLSCSL